MNQLLDLAMALIISPRQALMEITNEEKLKEGFFIWIFVVLLMALSLFQQGPGLVMQFLLMVLFMGAALLVHSAVIDYISGFWGGMGTARGITAGFMAGLCAPKKWKKPLMVLAGAVFVLTFIPSMVKFVRGLLVEE